MGMKYLIVVLKWIPGKRLGLQTHLAQDAEEQKFVNSLAVYSSNWIRIEFEGKTLYTDDKFRGKNMKTSDKNIWIKTWSILKSGMKSLLQQSLMLKNQGSMLLNYIGKARVLTHTFNFNWINGMEYLIRASVGKKARLLTFMVLTVKQQKLQLQLGVFAILTF